MGAFFDSLFAFVKAFGAWLDLDFWEVGIVVCFWLFCMVLIKLHRGNNDFRFELFFVDDQTKQPSLRRLAFFAALLISSWVVLHQEVFGKLTETVFGLYVGAWVFGYVAPAITEKITGRNPNQGEQQ